MHANNPLAPGDTLRQTRGYCTRKGFAIFHAPYCGCFDPCAFAKSLRDDNLAYRPRCVAKFLNDSLSPGSRRVQTVTVFGRLEDLSGLRFVETKVFRMTLLCEVTAAAQESPEADPFGDMFLDVPADELSFTLFRYCL